MRYSLDLNAISTKESLKAFVNAGRTTRSAYRKLIAIHCIQRWWKAVLHSRPCNQTQTASEVDRSLRGTLVLGKGGLPLLCPISYDVVKRKDAFRLVTESMQLYIYDKNVLIDYLLSTGKFIDPCTREPMQAFTVARLAYAAELDQEREGLVQGYNFREQIQIQQTERHNMLLAMEHICGITLMEAVEACRSFFANPEYLIYSISNSTFPEWHGHVDRLAEFDREHCESMLTSDIAKIRNLQKSAAADPHLILQFIVLRLEQTLRLIRGGHRSSSISFMNLATVAINHNQAASMPRVEARSRPEASQEDYSSLFADWDHP